MKHPVYFYLAQDLAAVVFILPLYVLRTYGQRCSNSIWCVGTYFAPLIKSLSDSEVSSFLCQVMSILDMQARRSIETFVALCQSKKM